MCGTEIAYGAGHPTPHVGMRGRMVVLGQRMVVSAYTKCADVCASAKEEAIQGKDVSCMCHVRY
eukprot:2954765-Rhodomonas_salina.11